MAGISEEDFMQLGVDADPEVAAQIQAILNSIQQGAENVNASLEKTASTSQQVAENLSQIGGQAVQGLSQATAQAEGLANQLEKINSLSENGGYDINAQALGYGVKGGMIGPEEPTAGGGQVGSFFSLAHGMSVAGHALGAPALREAGGAIYVEEGIRRTLPMLQQLNDTIASTPGLLAPLVEGFTALGIPMAGLLAVALPVAAAIGAVVVAAKLFHDGLVDVEQGLKSALGTQQSYYKFAETATTDDAEKRKKELESQASWQQKAVDETENALKQLESQTGISRNVGVSLPADVGAPFRDLTKQLDENKAKLADTNAEIGRLTGGLASNAFAANDAAAANKAYADSVIAQAQHDADLRQREFADTQMTSEAAKKRLDTLQNERQATIDQMNALQPLVDTSDDAKKKYGELNDKLSDETREINDLTGSIIPLIQAREAEAEAVKNLKKNLDEAAKAIDDYGKNKASAETALQNQIETAKLRESQAEAKQREDTSNAITDIRTKLGQKEAQLTTDYQRQIFDDRTKFYNEWAKLEIHANTQAQEELISHNEKLAEISRRAHVDDQQALLDRNFLQLAKIKQSSESQAQAENTRYAEQEAALQRHLQAQQVDLVNGLVAEMNQQHIANERKRADTEQQANYDIAHARVNETRKLQVIQQGLQNEIALYQLAENQKLAILQSTLNAITSAAFRNIASTVGGVVQSAVKSSPILSFLGGALGFKDDGGPFEAGSPFIMSENRPEALNFGSSSFRIPGAAMVMPLTSGSVDRNGGGNNITIPLTINGVQDPETTGRIARREVHQLLQQFFPG